MTTSNSGLRRIATRGGLLSAALLVLALGAGGIGASRFTRRAAPQHPEPLSALGVANALDVTLRTVDGLSLGAWFVPGTAAAPCLILLHGNGSSRTGLVPVVRKLAANGLCLLAITLRAHGDSDGESNDVGWSARHDIEAGVAFLERTQPGARRFIYGSSLGAAAALYAAPGLGDRVSGYVLESPYEDLDSAMRVRLDHALPLPLAVVGRFVLRPWALLLLGNDLAKFSPAEAAKAMPATARVLFLAGAADWRAPLDGVARIAQHVPGARLDVFPGAGHGELRRSDAERWHRDLLQVVR